ncbi:unnamed protein product [Moneuplotes crassus]|uniref:Transcription factor CBF/NF-Y/archaeal histone domain-containing protein n=1 Tax=Euplotes crassus TaxID=5936 RepID=A0AAD1XWB2_EUPCR|nr:unnamed protein product [Moneuplotes crassus]
MEDIFNRTFLSKMKNMIQDDMKIGKVTASVPLIMTQLLDIFVEDLCEKCFEEAKRENEEDDKIRINCETLKKVLEDNEKFKPMRSAFMETYEEIKKEALLKGNVDSEDEDEKKRNKDRKKKSPKKKPKIKKNKKSKAIEGEVRADVFDNPTTEIAEELIGKPIKNTLEKLTEEPTDVPAKELGDKITVDRTEEQSEEPRKDPNNDYLLDLDEGTNE